MKRKAHIILNEALYYLHYHYNFHTFVKEELDPKIEAYIQEFRKSAQFVYLDPYSDSQKE